MVLTSSILCHGITLPPVDSGPGLQTHLTLVKTVPNSPKGNDPFDILTSLMSSAVDTLVLAVRRWAGHSDTLHDKSGSSYSICVCGVVQKVKLPWDLGIENEIRERVRPISLTRTSYWRGGRI